MISLTEVAASNGFAWRVFSGVQVAGEGIAELRLSITEAGLGTLKINTDASLDTPTLRRIFEQLVVKVFDADLARKVQVLAHDSAQVLALEKSGFVPIARQPVSGTKLAATKLSVAEAMALATMARHIDLGVWGFRFDNGKRRAGQCNYTERVISISKHLVAHHSLDDVQQVVLHEIAHAMVGKDAGHGPVFKKQAAALGYRGRNFTGREIAANEAPWVGHCRAGHVHYRYRQPTRPLACGLCGRTFSRDNQIIWAKAA
jgi:predicted SprT family Zn-dependent metalloprotease